jgi:hypothetical protein
LRYWRGGRLEGSALSEAAGGLEPQQTTDGTDNDCRRIVVKKSVLRVRARTHTHTLARAHALSLSYYIYTPFSQPDEFFHLPLTLAA